MGTVTGYERVGGISGGMGEKCRIEQCMNAGAVFGANGVAGIIGHVFSGGTVKNVVSAASVSGEISTGAIVGGVFGNITIDSLYYLSDVCSQPVGYDNDGNVGTVLEKEEIQDHFFINKLNDWVDANQTSETQYRYWELGTESSNYWPVIGDEVADIYGYEYRIGVLTIRNSNGEELSTIPATSFLVTIPVTKLTDGGDSLIILAAYTASGQFKGLLYISVEDIPAGATVKITLPVNNSNDNIAQIKAFPVPRFSDPTPLGTARAFPT